MRVVRGGSRLFDAVMLSEGADDFGHLFTKVSQSYHIIKRDDIVTIDSSLWYKPCFGTSSTRLICPIIFIILHFYLGL